MPTRGLEQIAIKLGGFDGAYTEYTRRRLDRTLRSQAPPADERPELETVERTNSRTEGKAAGPGLETASERCAALDMFLSAQDAVDDRCAALDSFLDAQSGPKTLSAERRLALDLLLEKNADSS